MTTPSELASLLSLTAGDRPIDERPGLLILRAPLADAELRARWLGLGAAPPQFVASVSIVEAEGDAALEQGDAPGPNDLFRITVNTVRNDGVLRLFFPHSLQRCESDFAQSSQVLIAGMGGDETFSTYRNRVQLWSSDEPEPFAASEPLPDPRTYASDFTGQSQVPADIRPWLIRGEPKCHGETYRAWSGLAVRRLMAALADRISTVDGAVSYHFSGPPACAVTLSDDQVVRLLPRLQEGASWVFPDTRDADTRHLLLAAEWARSHRRGEPSQLGDGALESAKSAYAAYVKSGSKEALKALSELRKTVVDEGQKASQRAQDLAGAMWKDIAVAAVPFVLKILPDAAKAANASLTATLALCAAAFLIFSFSIQVFINARYFKRQSEGRVVWKREINVALRNQEVEELSEEPLKNSVADYRTVRRWVGAVYALLIFALVVFAGINLTPASPPPQQQASGSKAEVRPRGSEKVGNPQFGEKPTTVTGQEQKRQADEKAALKESPTGDRGPESGSLQKSADAAHVRDVRRPVGH